MKHKLAPAGRAKPAAWKTPTSPAYPQEAAGRPGIDSGGPRGGDELMWGAVKSPRPGGRCQWRLSLSVHAY